VNCIETFQLYAWLNRHKRGCAAVGCFLNMIMQYITVELPVKFVKYRLDLGPILGLSKKGVPFHFLEKCIGSKSHFGRIVNIDIAEGLHSSCCNKRALFSSVNSTVLLK